MKPTVGLVLELEQAAALAEWLRRVDTPMTLRNIAPRIKGMMALQAMAEKEVTAGYKAAREARTDD